MLFQYEQSAELQTIADPNRLESRLRAGVVPYEDMQSWARATPAGNYVVLRRDLRAAQEAWSAMALKLDEMAGRDSPPTRRISDTLEQIDRIIKRYGPPEAGPGDETADEAAADGGETADAGAASGGPGAKQRRLATREDALTMLGEIADYFRKTEPQSPLAYTIDDAIRRGRMSWPDLLAELVNDDSTRRAILVSLGIKAD